MSTDTLPIDDAPAPPGSTALNDEITAMRRLVNTIDGLDEPTRRRVLRWLGDRYQLGKGTD